MADPTEVNFGGKYAKCSDLSLHVPVQLNQQIARSPECCRQVRKLDFASLVAIPATGNASKFVDQVKAEVSTSPPA